jgi:hypothetical protein
MEEIKRVGWVDVPGRNMEEVSSRRGGLSNRQAFLCG